MTEEGGSYEMFLLISNGTELPPLAYDDAYDYNFQETRLISPPRKVDRGDFLQTVCTYSSSGQRTMTEVRVLIYCRHFRVN